MRPPTVFSTAPRAHLFTLPLATRRLLPISHHHSFSTTPSTSSATPPFRTGPSPPRLPKEDQEIFETLQRQSTGAFSTPRAAAPQDPKSINQSPDATVSEADEARNVIADRLAKLRRQSSSSNTTSKTQAETERETKPIGKIESKDDGETLHPNVRRGAPPEFEGDRNPKTGEVGGPKNEPLRWGGAGEWSYNGRTTDF